MYAIALLRYRRPLEEVLAVLEPHRAYLRSLQERGLLLASGALVPRNGGALLLCIPDGELHLLDQIREQDPFTQHGLAYYEIWPWDVNLGRDKLAQLL